MKSLIIRFNSVLIIMCDCKVLMIKFTQGFYGRSVEWIKS